MKATPVPNDPDLVSPRENLTHLIHLQVTVNQRIVTSVRDGTFAKLAKDLQKSPIARELVATNSTLNGLALRIQTRYPELNDWSFLQ